MRRYVFRVTNLTSSPNEYLGLSYDVALPFAEMLSSGL